MPFQNILERLKYTPWFCTPGAYAAMSEVIETVMQRARSGGAIDPKAMGFDLSDLKSRREMSIDRNGIANIHVLGIMGRGIAPIEKLCGRTDYADLDREITRAQSDARAALFDFDTPGGAAVGLDQTAKLLGNMTIPKVGFTEGTLGSAGVYLAAGLDRIFVASGALMGSVGTMLPWKDTSKLESLMGVTTRVFVNEGAKFKGISPSVPLTADQESFLQDFANALGSQFRSHIETYRSPDEEVYKAGAYIGQAAVDLGLADQVGGQDAAMSFLLHQLNS